MTARIEDFAIILLQKNKQLLEECSMSRYTGPSWKLSRRLGFSLSGTGKEIARRPITRKTKITSYVRYERTSICYFIQKSWQN